MSEIQITSQQIKSLYRQAQRIYHLHTMLNNILLNKMEFGNNNPLRGERKKAKITKKTTPQPDSGGIIKNRPFRSGF